MKRLFSILLISLTLLSFDETAQDKNVLSGVVTDGHRNRLIGINAMIKGTAIGTVSDVCGRFTIPIDNAEFTLLFHGMTYDDFRVYEIRLKRGDLTNDTIVFQLGHGKVENPNCRKVDKTLKRYVIE